MSLPFPDKVEDCSAVREAFILLLPHCGGERVGRRGCFYLAQAVVCCIYVSLTTFVTVFKVCLIVFGFFSFLLLYQNPEMAGQNLRRGSMICFLNKHELQLRSLVSSQCFLFISGVVCVCVYICTTHILHFFKERVKAYFLLCDLIVHYLSQTLILL